MKKFFLSIIYIFIFNISYSQSIKIELIDSITNAPVPYSSIIFSDETGTYSNNQGVFYLKKDVLNFKISHIAYYDKILRVPLSDTIIKLRPKDYQLQEIVIRPNVKKAYLGFNKFKTEFTKTGFTGDEIAVFIPNNENYTRLIQEIFIVFDNRKIVKTNLGVNFTSVFKVNFYSVKENIIEPDVCILKEDIILTTKDISKKFVMDISRYEISMPIKGVFVSIEWVGILSETNELRTDYKKRIEPSISTTFKQTNTKVYIRNKFKDLKWKPVDKNNDYSTLLKKDNYYTPCIGVSVK